MHRKPGNYTSYREEATTTLSIMTDLQKAKTTDSPKGAACLINHIRTKHRKKGTAIL
jgi:hypothetical protein